MKRFFCPGRFAPRLLPNWRDVLLYAWSVRWVAASVLFSVGEAVLPLFEGYLAAPRGVLAGLGALCGGIGFAARLVAQKRFHPED